MREIVRGSNSKDKDTRKGGSKGETVADGCESKCPEISPDSSSDIVNPMMMMANPMPPTARDSTSISVTEIELTGKHK